MSPRIRWLALALLCAAGACRSPATRPSLRVHRADGERPAVRWKLNRVDVHTRAAAVVIGAEVEPGASNRDPLADLDERLSGNRMPSFSGMRLLLGVGQAPYDDAPHSNAIQPGPLRGFSDSLIQLQVEDRLAPGLSLVGAVAASRYQDEPLLSGLGNAEFAWVTVGLSWSF